MLLSSEKDFYGLLCWLALGHRGGTCEVQSLCLMCSRYITCVCFHVFIVPPTLVWAGPAWYDVAWLTLPSHWTTDSSYFCVCRQTPDCSAFPLIPGKLVKVYLLLSLCLMLPKRLWRPHSTLVYFFHILSILPCDCISALLLKFHGAESIFVIVRTYACRSYQYLFKGKYFFLI